MNRGTKVILGALMLIAGLAGTARAGVVFGFGQITTNGNVPSAAQYTVEVSDGGPIGGHNSALFTIRNSGSIASSITEVYFQDGTLLSFQSLTAQTPWNGSTGVVYGPNTTNNQHLPGDPTFTAHTTVQNEGFWNSEDANIPSPFKGINPGEFLTLRFELTPGNNWIDTVAAMQYSTWPGPGEGKLRLGLHVQAINNAGSESFVNNHSGGPGGGESIPLPAEAAMAGAGLLGLIGIRSAHRRRRD